MKTLFQFGVLSALLTCFGCGFLTTKPGIADIEQLTTDLKEGGDRARAKAADALASLGPDGKPAVTALLIALRDENEAVRRKVMTALVAIGPDATMLSNLQECLKDSDQQCRAMAAEALGMIGRPARAALPDLRRALRDIADPVREMAQGAIDKIEAP
jgi:HEAT repeat protein